MSKSLKVIDILTQFSFRIIYEKTPLAPQQFVIFVIDGIIKLYVTNLISSVITDKTLQNINI